MRTTVEHTQVEREHPENEQVEENPEPDRDLHAPPVEKKQRPPRARFRAVVVSRGRIRYLKPGLPRCGIRLDDFKSGWQHQPAATPHCIKVYPCNRHWESHGGLPSPMWRATNIQPLDRR